MMEKQGGGGGWWDKIINEILREVGAHSLTELEGKQLQRSGRVKRLDTKKGIRIKKKKTMDRPGTRWLCHVLEDIMNHGKRLQDSECLWAGRRGWRLLIH